MAKITEKDLEEELKRIEEERRAFLKRLKLIRLYAMALIFWIVGTLILLIASFFNSGIDKMLDLYLYIGNITVIAFIIHLFPPKEASWRHKLLMLACIAINAISICTFIFDYIF